MANSAQNNYYSNPAFCQQSEFYSYSRQPRASPRKGLSPQRGQNIIRQSPVGAQSPARVVDAFQNVREELPPKPGPKPAKIGNDNYQEQDFYEEMLVDDTGVVKQKKIVVVASSNDNRNANVSPRYALVPQNDNQGNRGRYAEHGKMFAQQENGNRYAVVSPVENEASHRNQPSRQKHRYEYIPMQTQDANYNHSPAKREQHEEVFELGNRRIHRYAVIPAEEETELTTTTTTRYQENPNQDYRYSIGPQQAKIEQYRRYEYIDSIQDTAETYEYANRRPPDNNCLQRNVTSPIPIRKQGNPYATQKLHELLTTPKKSQTSYSRSPQRVTSPPSTKKFTTPTSVDPFVTPNKTSRTVTRERPSKAQQKLNYTLSTRQVSQDKRHTAIVAPICSSPVQSVYSETTFSNKSESWMNLSGHKQPVHATLTVAAVMMILCGGLTSCLCFYMVSFMGRLYFLDFGIVSGFACLVLGVLGCRSRNHYYWLPNRNYMSGYIILTLFSLLTCVGLLVLLFMQPKPGSPLADMTSGAVCGISVLSLILASAGVMASYCCRLPPPDNRVEHCARGFTV